MAFTEVYVKNASTGTGDGSSLANAMSWATMLTSLSAGQRANVYGAITRTTSADTFTNAGTAANPMAIRGINSTLDDLEANGRTRGGALVTTNFPVVTYTTGNITLPTAIILEHLSITSAKTSSTITANNANCIIRRCSISNTATSANSLTVSTSASTFVISDCDVSNTSTGSTACALNIAGAGHCDWCYITGNTSGAGGIILGSGSSNAAVTSNTILNAGYGVNSTNTAAIIVGNSFRNITGVYLKMSGSRIVINNVAWGVGGSSQWYQSSGTVAENNQLYNFVGNMGVADADLGNWINRNGVTLTADPFTSSTDLTLNNTSGGGALVRAAGYPAYLDGGAWQHQDSGGGGGGSRLVGLSSLITA